MCANENFFFFFNATNAIKVFLRIFIVAVVQPSDANFFLFFFFLIRVLTSSLTSVSRSFKISRMRSQPSELEAVDNASGDLLAIIGDDRGVSKSSKDSGLVKGLAIFLELPDLQLSSSEVTEGPLEVAVEDEMELSIDAKELVSDLVGDPPTFGLCGGGLGGGALGLEGRVVAMEAGLFTEDFFKADTSDLELLVLEGLWRRGIIGGG